MSIQSLGTLIPSQLADETRHALLKLSEALGGDPTPYVANRLQMSDAELSEALASEQVEGVALAIYNIEARGQSLIIGDQTGIGKGRQAAALIRYGIRAGYFPVFLTDRYTLFSDMYRDCKALGIADARPLVVNSKVSVVDFDRPTVAMSKTDEVWSSQQDDDEDADDEEIAGLYTQHYAEVYKSPRKAEMNAMYRKGDFPADTYEYMMLTYSQLKDAQRDATRLKFLTSVCCKHRVLFVFDEAHKSSSVSDGKVSVITQSINSVLGAAPQTQCVFLSATFAKRPESLITFMQQTMLSSLASSDTLSAAFANGGVPMQEYVASRLAREGQMIRREHSGEGVPEPTYTYLEAELPAHSKKFDRVMYWFRYMVGVSDTIKDFVATAKEMDVKAFRPYPTRQQLFYINKVLLLALKAGDVAAAAVREVQAGRCVVIGMSDTLECVLRDSVDPITGECSRGDFSTILLRLLQKTVSNPHDPSETIFDIDLTDTPDFLQEKLAEIRRHTEEIERGLKNEILGLPMSPIDVIRQLITREGIRFEECTGRARQLEYLSPDGSDNYVEASVVTRKKRHTSHIYNDFQNNKIDVILVNATGAIGASAHATPTAEVPEEQVRQRKMLIVQNDLDVNIDLQKRGRINRTGQLAHIPPLYEYIITAIPSEKRLNMMLRAKLRSLSANTTANQDQERGQADFIDITNKYGNIVAQEFIAEHKNLADMFGLKKKCTASQLLARIAMLYVSDQQAIIDDLFAAYQNMEQELRRINQWDLEREHRDFEAEFVSEELFSAPVDDSALGAASMLTTFSCRHRTFPYKAADLTRHIREACKPYGREPGKSEILRAEITAYYDAVLEVAKNDEVNSIENLVNETLQTLTAAGVPMDGAKVLIEKYNSITVPPIGALSKFIGPDADRTRVTIALNEYRSEKQTYHYRRKQTEQTLYARRELLRSVLSRAVIGQGYANVLHALGPVSREYPRIYAVLKEVRFGKDPAKRFAPSKVQFVFALSAEQKELVINLSTKGKSCNYDRLNAILYSPKWEFAPKMWDREIAKYNNQVLERKIITGNILGAFAHPLIEQMHPRFITFTLAPDAEGHKATERGLLLPMGGYVEKVSESVVLPLAEGLKYANARQNIYNISGIGVSFSISPSSGDRENPGLWYRVGVDDADSAVFASDSRFYAIRGYFNAKAVSGKRKQLKYTTPPLAYNSPEFNHIMSHLASMRGVIIIPKTHLTVGEIKNFAKKRQVGDNANWPSVDWQKGIPAPPQKGVATPALTSAAPIDETANEVDEFPREVVLCRQTLPYQGRSFAEKGVKESMRKLCLQWQEFAKEIPAPAQLISEEILRMVVLSEGEPVIKFSTTAMDAMNKIVEQVQLSEVGKIIATYKEEMLMLAPPKERAQAFLDSCFCDPRLDKIRQSLENYISGRTPVIG